MRRPSVGLVRGMAVAGMAAAAVLLPAGPAGATFTTNTIGCAGSAEITGDNGSRTTVNANDPTAVVPRSGSASWSGNLDTVTHNHSGKVILNMGPFSVDVGSWGPSPNATNTASASGTTSLPSALEDAPAGRYSLEGFHVGDEGGCAGRMEVEIDDGAMSNAAGYAGPIGTVVAAGLLAYAARPRLRS